jgi:hypothetical protein
LAKWNTAAAARPISGTSWKACESPSASASSPVTSGPAASPSRLFTSVSIAKAVPWIGSGVRLATIAPAGPLVPAARNMPSAIATSCGVPCGKAKASDSSAQLPTLQAIARLNLCAGALRHRRSLSTPQAIMPTPLTSTISAETAPATSVAIA